LGASVNAAERQHDRDTNRHERKRDASAAPGAGRTFLIFVDNAHG
jgi:hypothetical protein